jgi:hypothetical protein
LGRRPPRTEQHASGYAGDAQRQAGRQTHPGGECRVAGDRVRDERHVGSCSEVFDETGGDVPDAGALADQRRDVDRDA